MLFQVISERSERASVIVTTNLEFSRWTELFENELMVAAMIDRLTFRSHVFNMNVKESYRLEQTLLKEKRRI
jgi:DNA replication protein DnaC